MHRLLPHDTRLLGIGIGISGFVDRATGTLIYSPILGWEGVEIAKSLEEEYNIPVFVDNDVNALTLAELWYGAGRHFQNFICVTIGEGIGAGIVIEGHLYEGAAGGAGEIGHTCLDPSGPRCRCGEAGCLEVFASDTFLTRRAQEALQMGQGLFQSPAPEELLAAARRGDPIAQGIFAEMGRHLGLGLKNVINLLNPEAVILGGERINAYTFFGPALEEEVHKHAFPQEAKELRILLAELGEAGWIIGSATLALSSIFELPIYKRPRSSQSSDALSRVLPGHR
jgi:predicted NBD/HSP70 family sugar kinase